MKTKYIIMGVIILLVVALEIIFFTRKETNNIGDDNVIKNITYFRFNYTNGYFANADIEYEIKCEDTCTYLFKDIGIDYDDAITKEISVDSVKELESILNKNKVIRWNNFSAYDKDVLDGDSFTMNINYDNNARFVASGYMKYPTDYDIVKKELDSFFNRLNKEGDN